MKVPKLYIPAAILFWGWQMQMFWIAIPMACIVFYPQVSRTRFDLSVADFNRFVDTCTIFLAAAIVYALVDDAQNAIWMLLKWLPLVFFPILGAQQFSVAGKIDIRSFFLTARKRIVPKDYGIAEKIDVSYPYVLFCILSAGSGTDADRLFFPVSAGFCIWGLWHVRSRRVPDWAWISFVAVVLVCGYVGHKTLFRAGMAINRWMIIKYRGAITDSPFKSQTALGELGRLKLSNKIVMRAVFEDGGDGKSFLVYNGVYNNFYNSGWYTGNQFSQVIKEDEGDFWPINSGKSPGKNAKIYSRAVRNRAVLSLPAGPMRISGFDADRCQKNGFQVVRMINPPSLIVSKVTFTGQPAWDQQPYKSDYAVSKKETKVVSGIVDKLQLNGRSPQAVLAELEAFFSGGFSYSLELKGKGEYDTPIQNFLLNTKQGHCELFATASALLLRQAGIPARYVTGYIVHEYSGFEKKYLVRQRDAHAWVRAFVDGRWQDFDTTPAGFVEADASQVSVSKWADILSFAAFKLSQLRHETGRDLVNRFGLWLILPLGVMLFYRLRKTRSIKRVTRDKEKSEDDIKKELFSFYKLEAWLANKGLPRKEYETYSTWLERIRPHLAEETLYRDLKDRLELHNRVIFGKGVPAAVRQELTRTMEALIQTRPFIK